MRRREIAMIACRGRRKEVLREDRKITNLLSSTFNLASVGDLPNLDSCKLHVLKLLNT
jgi:hypothetical protein